MKKPGEMLYLDYAASAPLRPGAWKVLERSMKEDFANPSSAHKPGKDLFRRIETCRKKFLQLLGAGKNDRLVFTGSATESNNTVIEGIGLKAGDSVLVSFADHPSVTVPMERLKKRNILVKELPLQNDGTPDEAAFLKLLDDTVKLVILTHVNNQSGAIIDICRLSGEIKVVNPGVHIHVDAAQGFGKIPFSLGEGQIDSMCISSHKIGGPKGIAGLVLDAGVRVSPLLYGGGQENGLRSSTQAAPLIFSFYQAAQEAVASIESSLAHVTRINRLAREGLEEKINRVRFPFFTHSSPYILTFILPGISSDIILRHLEQRGIMISSTSACSSKVKGASPVFTALHLPEKDHKFVLRVSFGHDTTELDVMRFCDTLASIYDDLEMFVRRQ
ncbi:MAG: cysteine desulfurase [Candidatus Aminicenantes bacterium]|nr:MAG: cysteine desulfurase [Candidatus Aminicenantes bacterium]